MPESGGDTAEQVDRLVVPVGRRKITSRADLGQVAFDLFDQQRFERTTIDDIASAAGIGRRTFFRYFPSKNDVPCLLAGAGPFSAQGAVFARLFLLLPGIGWLSARVARRSAGQPGQPTGALVRLTPYVTVAVAPFLPLAAGLYLATTTAWTLAERTILHRARVAD